MLGNDHVHYHCISHWYITIVLIEDHSKEVLNFNKILTPIGVILTPRMLKDTKLV